MMETDLWPPVLTTDEPFQELVEIGQHLPNGRKNLLKWEQQMVKERKEVAILLSEIGSYSDAQTSASAKRQKSSTGKRRNPIEVETSAPVGNPLTTTESFPAKWLVSSDDDDDISDRSLRKRDPFGVSSRRKKSGCECSCRKRKRPVFGSSDGKVEQQQQQHWRNEERRILQSIPTNPSGIIGVMGRRIDMNRFVDEGDAGLYSMLRAWVRDDPHNPEHEYPANARRKTLLQYVKMEKNDKNNEIKGEGEDKNKNKDKNKDKDNGKDEDEDDNSNGEAGGTTTTNGIASPLELSQTATEMGANFVEWLGTHPDQRLSLPYYPTQKEMREHRERREAKRAAKSERKERLVIIKEKLKKKGIIL